MKFIPYEQWLKANPDLVEEVDCPDCYGEGTHMCSCGDWHDCGECNGTGKIENPNGRKIYAAECAKAAAAYTASQSK